MHDAMDDSMNGSMYDSMILMKDLMNNARKMKFSLKDFFGKCDQMCGFGHIY